MPRAAVPAAQCSATAKATRERCRRLALRGAAVCPVHGVSGAARRKAAERVALAEQLAADPHRHPAVVLLDALHAADVLARRAAADGASVDELVAKLSLAAQIAKTTLTLRADERHQADTEQTGELLAGTVRRILDRLDLSPAQRAMVPAVVPEEFRRTGELAARPGRRLRALPGGGR